MGETLLTLVTTDRPTDIVLIVGLVALGCVMLVPSTKDEMEAGPLLAWVAFLLIVLGIVGILLVGLAP